MLLWLANLIIKIAIFKTIALFPQTLRVTPKPLTQVNYKLFSSDNITSVQFGFVHVTFAFLTFNTNLLR